MMKSTLLLVALVCIGMVWASPGGAPVTACGDMIPRHALNEPQSSPSPYTVSLSSTKVQPRADVTVTISATSTDIFRGFLVQAQDTAGEPVGTFEVGPGVKAIDCGDGMQNAATHVINDNKTSIDIGWVAPSTPTDVVFRVSIVRIYEEFWTDITASLSVILEL